ncbi:MAG TPA: NAD-dependent epimerase/dehydratase family protein [Chloroflexi bacterium]|nr:NAD-dependent epimerase/dehydratase family protein [Chloroflexota bacterium]
MPHYLVTGVAGFIASRVAEMLLEAGHTVVGVDNLNDAYDRRLKDYRLARLTSRAGFVFHALDITDRAAVFALGEDESFDAVINLAARAGVRYSVENPWVYIETNTTGALNLLEMSRRTGVPKFVQASTSSLYGEGNTAPYREDANTDHVLSPYAASKKAAEALCYTYHRLYGLDVTVFRYFTVYGPAGRPDMAPFRFIQWISEGRPLRLFGDGSQSRDFTYVDDIARGTLLGLKPLGYEVINLGSDRPYTVKELIALIERAVGRKADIVHEPRHPADVETTWASIEKARRLLGWEPAVALPEGIRRTVAWYQAERAWAAQIPTGA